MHTTTVPADLKARLVGINHVALEVGDVDAAVAFYRETFNFEVFRRTSDAAFISMGDAHPPSGGAERRSRSDGVADD